jgi:hypothetical protein
MMCKRCGHWNTKSDRVTCSECDTILNEREIN